MLVTARLSAISRVSPREKAHEDTSLVKSAKDKTTLASRFSKRKSKSSRAHFRAEISEGLRSLRDVSVYIATRRVTGCGTRSKRRKREDYMDKVRIEHEDTRISDILEMRSVVALVS